MDRYEYGRCDCPCGHQYGSDLGEDCTDDRCGYCGMDLTDEEQVVGARVWEDMGFSPV